MRAPNLRAEVVADLARERFGPVPWWETLRRPLPLPRDTPSAWLRRRAVLLDALEGCPQQYRRGRREAA